ncbi:MAG: hypothetical protein K0S30_1692 [Clostridia bacterium]|nr:hypothetical protein [Clostridia bacterium]
MLEEFIRALFLIFMAEMGDKTQILAIAFATKFKVKKVLIGIFIGCLLNHGLAVILGAYLSTLIPIQSIQIIAGISFILFSLWTLRVEEEEEEETTKAGYGAVITVALAFFIGELGDKTQLTTIMLAADAQFPFIVLMGTVSGMVITGGLGIWVGSKLGDRIPEFAIKMVSASIFMFFGVTKLYASLPEVYLNGFNIGIFIIVLSGAVLFILMPTFEIRRQGKLSVLRQTAKELQRFSNQMNEQVNHICLGQGHCGVCQKGHCIVGYTRLLIEHIEQGKGDIQTKDFTRFQKSLNKNYDKDQVIKGLAMTLKFIMHPVCPSEGPGIVHEIRKNLEIILLNESVTTFKDLKQYLKEIEAIDKQAVKTLQQELFK